MQHENVDIGAVLTGVKSTIAELEKKLADKDAFDEMLNEKKSRAAELQVRGTF